MRNQPPAKPDRAVRRKSGGSGSFGGRHRMVVLSWIGIALAATMLPEWVPAGELYTWTDADGGVHISDRPPGDPSLTPKVIPYSSPDENRPPSPLAIQRAAPVTHPADRLQKRLDRLRERQSQLKTIIAQSQASIAEAEKEADTLRRRSGSYARRNVKMIERQLMVLRESLSIYQSDLIYVEADIAEFERDLKAWPAGSRGAPGRSDGPLPAD